MSTKFVITIATNQSLLAQIRGQSKPAARLAVVLASGSDH
jgi:hypothetical protein